MSSKKVFVLGAGGHGIASITPYLFGLHDTEVCIYYVPADSGGSTGTITNVFEYNNGILNQQIHGDTNHNVLPFGDMNKLIMSRLQSLGKDNYAVINQRSDDSNELITYGKELLSTLGCTKLEEDFVQYLSSYLNYYQSIRDASDFDLLETCLGNLWHTFLHFKTGNLVGINRFYKEHGIIPDLVKFDFTFHQRQTLIGSTIKAELLLREDIIDDSLHRLLPSTLKIADKEGVRTYSPVSEMCIEDLITSDLIIIPNGSIANWLAIVNSSNEVKTILKQKGSQGKVIWMANLFYSQNEFPLDTYLELVVDNYGIPLHLLSTNTREWATATDASKSLLEEYAIQGKTPNQLNGDAVNLINQIPWFSHSDDLKLIIGKRIEGIKYDILSVTAEIQKLYPSIQ
jgi:hypothetical protein